MYIQKHSNLRYTLVSLSLILSGCGSRKPTHALNPLQPRTAYDQITKKTEIGEVTVRCASCSRNELTHIFGRQGNSLLIKHAGMRIVPVQLYIENNSEYTWTLSPYDIRLPLADMQEIKNNCMRGATAHGITSFTLTGSSGIALAGLGAAASIFHPVLGASLIGAGCSLMLIAPVRSHTTTARISAQNAHFSHVLDTLTLGEQVVVYPREQVSKLIFVKQTDAKDSFMLRLCDRDNPDHTLSFNMCYEKQRS